MSESEKSNSQTWRVWVEPRRRLVSFHRTEGGTLMEFRSYEMFMECLGQYAERGFRFQ